MIITVLGIVMLMESIDAGVLNTSLPQIAFSLHINPLSLKVALTTYLLASGAFIPMGNWISDRYGLNRVLVLAISGFMLASIACAFSTNLVMMTVARGAQGATGAFMIPLARATIVRLFKDRVAIALAKTGSIFLIGNLLGPIIGGCITTFLNWRFIFLINIPIGLVILYLIIKIFPQIPKKPVHYFDYLGFFMLAIALSSALFAVDSAIDPTIQTSLKTTMAILSIFLCLSYLVYSSKVTHPLVDLQVLKNKFFSYYIGNSIMLRLFVTPTAFIIPLYLQTQLGYNALESSLSILPMLISAILCKSYAANLTKHENPKKILKQLYSLIVLTEICLAILTFKFNLTIFIIALFLLGFSLSCLITLLNTAIYNSLTEATSSAGLTINNCVIQLSGSFGIALVALVLVLSSHQVLSWNAVLPKFSYALVLAISAIIIFGLSLSLRYAPKYPAKSSNLN